MAAVITSNSRSFSTPTAPSPLRTSIDGRASPLPGAQSRPKPTRMSSFPTSRPLRPFASIAQALQPQPQAPSAKKAPVKVIEPPKGFDGGCFVLNLTQAEFSRRD